MGLNVWSQTWLGRLLCVHHLIKLDESKLCELLSKTSRNILDRKKSSFEIIKDIYGFKLDSWYEYSLAESMEADDFTDKLALLKDRWESIFRFSHPVSLKQEKIVYWKCYSVCKINPFTPRTIENQEIPSSKITRRREKTLFLIKIKCWIRIS